MLAFLLGLHAVAQAAPPQAEKDSLSLARAWIESGEYARAEGVARRALAHAESGTESGTKKSDRATALDLLTESRWRQGFASEPETRALAESALALRDTGTADTDSGAAQALLNLGAIRSQTGDFDGARPLVDRALAIRTRWPGRDSLALAWALNERGALALRAGDRELARACMARALALRERALGPWHPLVAWSCSNLSQVVGQSGDLVAARRLLERCVRIRARALPADHPDRARGLKDLADVLYALGDYAHARPLYDQSLRMRIRVLGENHPEVANGLSRLAGRLLDIRDLPGALRAARRSLAIRERVFDSGNPEVAISLLQVGRLMAESGEKAAAIDTIRRALAIRETVFGPNSPVTAAALDELACALVASGRADSACGVAHRAIGAKTAGLGAGHPDIARSWHVQAEALRAAGRIGEAADAALACERVAREHLAASAAQLGQQEALEYEAVRITGLDLAVRIALSPEATPAIRRRVWDAVVRARGQVLDQVAARLHASRSAEVGLNEVLARLPRGTALVSYFRCQEDHYPVARPAAYAAFVAGPGADSVVTAIRIGPALPVDTLVDHWRATVLSHATTLGKRAARVRAGVRLRERIWDPLQAGLRGARRVLLVPDGAMHGVNFYALPLAPDHYLVEGDVEIDPISAERRLAAPAPGSPGSGRLLALGGIRYSRASAAGRPDGMRSGGVSNFPFLPGSEREVQAISALWEHLPGGPRVRHHAFLLIGAQATCANLEARASSCEVLHIATHGVFAGEGIDPLQAFRDRVPNGAPPPSVFLHSGLVLAPAPAAGSGDPQRDGFLSAADVARLDLRAARWVVLSGCETGAGRVLAREGALGLRSAFELAGARVIIMSLWKVDDESAEEWTGSLYRARYQHGMSTGAAVRQASRDLLERRRRLGRPDEPADWAGFVACGVDD